MQLNINCVNTTKVCFWETWVGILLESSEFSSFSWRGAACVF